MKFFRVTLPVLLLCGCNVFYAVGNDPDETVEPAPDPNTGQQTADCTSSCACTGTCDVDCSGCTVDCTDNGQCSGAVNGGTVNCEDDANCDMACTSGTCLFVCTDNGTECQIDCADDATCRLQCGEGGPGRGNSRDEKCRFVNCDDLTDCGDGVFVCNGSC